MDDSHFLVLEAADLLADLPSFCARRSVLGNELALPVFASPAGVRALVDDEGERATARACGRAGTLFGLSQHAPVCIEDVAAAALGFTLGERDGVPGRYGGGVGGEAVESGGVR